MLRPFALFIFYISVSGFSIQTMSHEKHCTSFDCESPNFDKLSSDILLEDGEVQKCQTCDNCTDSGYSVCLRSRHLEDQDQPCKCAHSLPVICDRPGKTFANSKLVNTCYRPSLRRPPKLSIENKNDTVIAVVSTFWTDPYWKELQLSNLTIFYEFLVDRADQCDGIAIENTNEEKNYTCSNTLPVDINGNDTDTVDDADDDDDDDDTVDDQKTTAAETSLENSDISIEVEFDRSIFAGAKYVKFWFEVDVKQLRQIDIHEVEIIPEIITVMASEFEEFDIQTDIYGTGKEPDDDDDDDEIQKVEDQDKMDDSDDAVDNDGDKDGKDDGSIMDKKTIEEISKQTDFFGDDDSSEDDEDDKVTTQKGDAKIPETTTIFDLKYKEGEVDADSKDDIDDDDSDASDTDDQSVPARLRDYSSRFQPSASSAAKKKESSKEKEIVEDDSEESQDDAKEIETTTVPQSSSTSTAMTSTSTVATTTTSTATTSTTTTMTMRTTSKQQTATSTNSTINEKPDTVKEPESGRNSTVTFVSSILKRVNTTQFALATGALGLLLIVSTLVLVSWCCCRKKETFSTYHASTRKDNHMNGNSTYKYTATLQTRPDTLPEKELLNQ